MGVKRESLGKLLVVCKESYTYPMAALTSELLNKGYEVEAIFVHPAETTLKNHSYVSFKAEHNIPIHTFDDELEFFCTNYKRASEFLESDYLRRVEKSYMEKIPIGLVLMSSQLFTTAYHSRSYFQDLDYSQQLFWLQLVLKKVEKILFEGGYSRILDIDISELGRTCLSLVSDSINVPYVTLESSRYKSIFLPTRTMGRFVDQYFLSSYLSGVAPTSRSIDEVLDFKKAKNIMVPDYDFNSTSRKTLSVLLRVRAFMSRLRALTEQWIENRSHYYVFKKKPMLASLMDSYWFFTKWFVRDILLSSKSNRYFSKPDLSRDYLYFPLHLIPESTTLVKAPFYPNEVSVIEAISKALPLGMMLLVKEHPAMIGEREFSVYKRILRLPNVKIIDPSAGTEVKEMILQSRGVVTLTGTSAFEAAMLGRPAIMFGTSFFEVIKGIHKVDSFDKLPQIIRQMINTPLDNIASCAKYIDCLNEYGRVFPMAEVLERSRDFAYDKSDSGSFLETHIGALADLLLTDVQENKL